MIEFKEIKKGKNLLIYLPNEDQPNLLFKALNNYFLNNKKLITELSIIYELIMTSEEFCITSKSISQSLGISTKTLKSKFQNLREKGILYIFQFSTGKDSSSVFYLLNLTGQRIGELSAFFDISRKFNIHKTHKLITYECDRLHIINDQYKVVIDKLFDLFKEKMLNEITLNENSTEYFKNSIYNALFSELKVLENMNDKGINELVSGLFLQKYI